MQGRITEKHLSEAERCMPGIQRYYRGLACKPTTFLQLLWAFEGQAQRRPRGSKAAARSRSR